MNSERQMTIDFLVVENKNGQVSTPELGLTRNVLAYNDKLSLVEHRMAKGWTGAMHSHLHHQIVYVVRGHLRVACQGKMWDVRTGDSFVVRGGIEHGASAVEDSVVVDVFTPCRDEYIKRTNS